MKAGTPKTKKGFKNKEFIYHATLDLFNSKGFDKTTLNDICKASGIAMGTFYHYYPSKESILLEYFAEIGSKVQTHYQALEDKESLEALKDIIDYIIDLYLQGNPNILGRFSAIEMESTDDLSRSEIFPLKTIIADILKRGYASGNFRSELSSDYIAYLILAIFIGVLTTWTSRGMHYDLKSHLFAQLQPLLAFITKHTD